jgi:hypothetical protein
VGAVGAGKVWTGATVAAVIDGVSAGTIVVEEIDGSWGRATIAAENGGWAAATEAVADGDRVGAAVAAETGPDAANRALAIGPSTLLGAATSGRVACGGSRTKSNTTLATMLTTTA